MPFEQPGNSFPGSAFYYLAGEAPRQQQLGDGIHSDAEDTPAPFGASGAAQALRIDNSGVDRNRAVQCLTAAIYYEAASEPDAGQRAVAQVVLNRVAHPAYPKTVCGVVYQNAHRHNSCQFTFACDGIPDIVTEPDAWERAKRIARDTLDGKLWMPEVAKSTHYHAFWVHPSWVGEMKKLYSLGVHKFYRPLNWGDGSDEPTWGDAKATEAEAKRL
jgi:spore germination cell wall hydrolase CwlJ-like protein